MGSEMKERRPLDVVEGLDHISEEPHERHACLKTAAIGISVDVGVELSKRLACPQRRSSAMARKWSGVGFLARAMTNGV